MKRGELRAIIRRAETAAAVLRTPGHRFSGEGERRVIAETLESLAQVARRMFDPEYELAPDQHLGGEDVVTDLFDERGAA